MEILGMKPRFRTGLKANSNQTTPHHTQDRRRQTQTYYTRPSPDQTRADLKQETEQTQPLDNTKDN